MIESAFPVLKIGDPVEEEEQFLVAGSAEYRFCDFLTGYAAELIENPITCG